MVCRPVYWQSSVYCNTPSGFGFHFTDSHCSTSHRLSKLLGKHMSHPRQTKDLASHARQKNPFPCVVNLMCHAGTAGGFVLTSLDTVNLA